MHFVPLAPVGDDDSEWKAASIEEVRIYSRDAPPVFRERSNVRSVGTEVRGESCMKRKKRWAKLSEHDARSKQITARAEFISSEFKPRFDNLPFYGLISADFVGECI